MMLEKKVYFTPFEEIAGAEQIYESEYVIYADNTPLMYSSVGGAEAGEDLVQFVQAVHRMMQEQ